MVNSAADTTAKAISSMLHLAQAKFMAESGCRLTTSDGFHFLPAAASEAADHIVAFWVSVNVISSPTFGAFVFFIKALGSFRDIVGVWAIS